MVKLVRWSTLSIVVSAIAAATIGLIFGVVFWKAVDPELGTLFMPLLFVYAISIILAFFLGLLHAGLAILMLGIWSRLRRARGTAVVILCTGLGVQGAFWAIASIRPWWLGPIMSLGVSVLAVVLYFALEHPLLAWTDRVLRRKTSS